jgi:tetratricopeptide (TPR) repeat protein
MFDSTLTAKRILLNVSRAIVAALALVTIASAQAQNPAERQRAIDLFDANNFTEALPLLEKVAATNPNDREILSRLGFALFANSAGEKDPVARKKVRDRVRAILLKARSLGDNSAVTSMALEVLSRPDAGQISFSNIQAADAAVKEGEAAFVRGQLDQAIAAYKRALDADPLLYNAALFAGDAEFKKAHGSTDPQFRNAHFDAAGVWFAKAIAIDPNRETAYRYWGDALDTQGRTNDALDRFVEAIIADPYSRSPYVGLTQWAQRHKAQLGHPKIEPPNSTTTQGNQTTLNIDPRTLDSKDGSNNWLMYNLTRIAWSKSDFFKNYPAEKEYRHSLKEEAAALRMVAEACAKDLQSGKVKTLEPSLAMLVKLNQDGFIEPYILFAHPDQGIARDYPAYRAVNRDKLKRYWLSVVIIA